MAELKRGVDLMVFAGDGQDPIGYNESCSFTVTAETSERSYKGSNLWGNKEVQKLNAQVQCSGLLAQGDAGQDAVDEAVFEGAKIPLVWGEETPGTGSIVYSGLFICTNRESTADVNEAIGSYNYTFENSGPVNRVKTA